MYFTTNDLIGQMLLKRMTRFMTSEQCDPILHEVCERVVHGWLNDGLGRGELGASPAHRHRGSPGLIGVKPAYIILAFMVMTVYLF